MTPKKPFNFQVFPSCSPLLDCSFKDLKELLQADGEIIQCFHNPPWMCTQPVTRAHTYTHAYSNQHMSVTHIYRCIDLLQVFDVFPITCGNGLPVYDNHLPSLRRSLWFSTEQDLSHMNSIFDGVRTFERLQDLLAFSSPLAFFI